MTEETKKRGRKTKPKYEVVCHDADHLEKIGCELDWLKPLHDRYGFEKFEYIHKFRAFRCYKDGRHVDWIDVNNLALINGKRRLEVILMQHQPISPKRAVINYPWR